MKSRGRIIAISSLFAVAGACATVQNEQVETSKETNAIVLSETNAEIEKEESKPFECEGVYRVVVAHTYGLNQNLVGSDGKMILAAQSVAETILYLAASSQPEDESIERSDGVAVASIAAVAAALEFVEAESKRKARKTEPTTLYSDKKALMKIQHCLNIAKVSNQDARAAARLIQASARRNDVTNDRE